MQDVEVITEIAQAHDGSVGILHSLIDALANAGSKIIKFQMHIAEAESSKFDQFRNNFSKVDKTRFDYWKRMELTRDQWIEIKTHCERLGCEFLCTPFSVCAVEMLASMGIKRIKIGSGDVVNPILLENIAKLKIPMIISSGMSNFEELDQAVSILKKGSKNIAVMQCSSDYPVAPEQWGLNLICELKGRYNLPIGLSDHSGTIYPSLAAVALGADLIEVHGTFDRRMFGPDATSSLQIEEIEQLLKGVQLIRKSLNSPVSKTDISRYEHIRNLFGRTVSLRRSLTKGARLTFEDLEAAKPAGLGVPASDFGKILGRRTKYAISKGMFLKSDDFE
jgi:N-acetylneuraminate synthase